MQRVTWLSRKNKRRISQTDPGSRPGADKSALVLRQEPPFGSCCRVWIVDLAVCHHLPESLIPFKPESLVFIPAQTVRLLSVCPQEGGGVSSFLGVRGASV